MQVAQFDSQPISQSNIPYVITIVEWCGMMQSCVKGLPRSQF